MSDSRRIALLGSQSTGKSTYLGALVDALTTEKLQLHLEGLGEDAQGLQRLADPLLAGEYPQRTKADERLSLDAPLRTAGRLEPLSFTLRAGDYDGEEVERLFRDRIHGFSPEWTERAHAGGFLILLRPTVHPPRAHFQPGAEASPWQLLRREVPVPSSAPVGPAPSAPANANSFFGPVTLDESSPPPRAAPTDPVGVPTSLTTIELLQFIRHVRGLSPGERPQQDGERFRIALIVTSWDSVGPAWRARGPAPYLAQHLPLLDDYLWSNFLPDDVFRFGLSATGGDLRDPSHQQRYLSDPSGFVEWHDPIRGIQRTADIGLPLYWLLFGDSALGAP